MNSYSAELQMNMSVKIFVILIVSDIFDIYTLVKMTTFLMEISNTKLCLCLLFLTGYVMLF